MSAPVRIDVAEGKYTVVIDGGKLSALRYGEPWQDLTGNNLVYWLAVELQQARKAAGDATAVLKVIKSHSGNAELVWCAASAALTPGTKA